MRTPSGPTRFLLRVGFYTTAADLSTGECRSGSATAILEVGDEGAVDDGACGVGRGGLEVEDFFADLIAGEAKDWEGGDVDDGESSELGFDGEREFRGNGVGRFQREEREKGFRRAVRLRGENGGGKEGERRR